MARLIDADFLDDRCRRQMADEWNKRVAPVSWAEAYKEFLDDVWDAPTVDAVEVVHGRWEMLGDDYANCTNCGNIFETRPTPMFFKANNKYCRKCGATMDLEVK